MIAQKKIQQLKIPAWPPTLLQPHATTSSNAINKDLAGKKRQKWEERSLIAVSQQPHFQHCLGVSVYSSPRLAKKRGSAAPEQLWNRSAAPSPLGPFADPRLDLFVLVHEIHFQHGSAFIFDAPLPWFAQNFASPFLSETAKFLIKALSPL